MFAIIFMLSNSNSFLIHLRHSTRVCQNFGHIITSFLKTSFSLKTCIMRQYFQTTASEMHYEQRVHLCITHSGLVVVVTQADFLFHEHFVSIDFADIVIILSTSHIFRHVSC